MIETLLRKLTWDRPQAEWPRTEAGELAAFDRPLDCAQLLAADDLA